MGVSMMLPDLSDVEEFIIVADLRLGAGVDPQTGEPDVEERFHASGALVDMLEQIGSRPDRHRVCVIVLGDLLDLQLIEPSFRVRPDTRTARTLRRVDQVAIGHRPVIQAFGAAARAGVRLLFVAGDRDLELVRQSTRHRLATVMVPGPDQEAIDARARIGFSSWAVHVPGVLYAEHGGQFDDCAASDAPAAPWRLGDQERVRLPVGSLAALHAAERRARRAGGQGALGAWRSALAVGTAVAERWAPGRDLRRRAYRLGPLAEEAQRMGLPRAIVTEIDRRGEVRPGVLERRLVVERLGSRRGSRHQANPAEPLRAAARAIHALLAASGHGVSFVVFGHSGAADRQPLPAGGGYLNPGPWSGSRTASPDGLGVVVIDVDHEHQTCRARLAYWGQGTLVAVEGEAT